MNLRCVLSDELHKTGLSQREQVAVLTCVATAQRVLTQEREESISPSSYDTLLNDIASLLRIGAK
jgi:hypothetical protein